ncbi:hypothetical protein IJJ54_00905 [Candidatus Saccharibacteria bacterium]|nr:hypothetical protein [Candidatus Saccharibacteria bacterium]
MFDIELKNSDEMTIRVKEKTVNINVAQSTVDADLPVGELKGAGEYEIGDIVISAVKTKEGGVMYRLNVEGIKIGLVGSGVKTEELDELGPIDILGTADAKVVPVVEPKIVIPMGNMDFSEIKASVKVEKKLRIKNSSALPPTLEVYKLD